MTRAERTDKAIDALAKLPPLQRLTEAVALMNEHRAAIGRLARIRASAVRELTASGMSVAAVAKAVGVTRQEIYRLLRENP